MPCRGKCVSSLAPSGAFANRRIAGPNQQPIRLHPPPKSHSDYPYIKRYFAPFLHKSGARDLQSVSNRCRRKHKRANAPALSVRPLASPRVSSFEETPRLPATSSQKQRCGKQPDNAHTLRERLLENHLVYPRSLMSSCLPRTFSEQGNPASTFRVFRSPLLRMRSWAPEPIFSESSAPERFQFSAKQRTRRRGSLEQRLLVCVPLTLLSIGHLPHKALAKVAQHITASSHLLCNDII